MNKELSIFKKSVREAIANYMWSEGCSCCQDKEAHDEHKKALAKLLNVPSYDDGSGYNFSIFETKAKP